MKKRYSRALNHTHIKAETFHLPVAELMGGMVDEIERLSAGFGILIMRAAMEEGLQGGLAGMEGKVTTVMATNPATLSLAGANNPWSNHGCAACRGTKRS